MGEFYQGGLTAWYGSPMIVTSLSGFGAAYVEGPDFKCNDSQCYAIGPERQKIFEDYQKLLNRFATKLSFMPLVVDGFIGPATVVATRKVADAVIASGLDLDWVKTLAGSGSTRPGVAARISDFTVVARGLANTMLPPPAPTRLRMNPAMVAAFRLPSTVVTPGRTPGIAPALDVNLDVGTGAGADAGAGAGASMPGIFALSPTGKKVLLAIGIGAVALFLFDRRAKRAPSSAAG
jgi:hypothetical protein